MSEPAIALSHVSKVFSRTERRAATLKEGLIGSLRERARRDLIVALEDVSLEVPAGGALGVIGPNGSGKSTLLKLLAGISEPSGGEVRVRGRVLGLIELGAGFHGDLTGEENIRLQGALYGLSADQVEDQLDSILAFAGLEDFRRLPVRHYSSGMFVRLGFAIAVHVEPDVLLVDEVLAVGDLAFQEKCLEAIRRLRERGMTLVLVTHFAEQAERLCDQVLWLEEGRAQHHGPVFEVLGAYHEDLIGRRFARPQGPLDDRALADGLPGRFGSGEARVISFRVLDAAGRVRTHFQPREPVRIELEYESRPEIEAVDCSVLCHSEDVTFVTMWRAERQGMLSRPREGRGRFGLEIAEPGLLPGRYGLTVALTPPGNPYQHHDLLYKLFHVSVEPESERETAGLVELHPACTRV